MEFELITKFFLLPKDRKATFFKVKTGKFQGIYYASTTTPYPWLFISDTGFSFSSINAN